MTRRLTRNAAQCGRCKDVIVSRFRHNFATCSCGALSVDGGLDYRRVVYDQDVEVIDLCQYEGEAEAA